MPETPDVVFGTGTSANDLVQVRVARDGKIDSLQIDPRIMRHGTSRPPSFQDLAEEIKNAVNNAIDDLNHKATESADGIMEAFNGDLRQVTVDFERAMSQIADDITRAQRRLES